MCTLNSEDDSDEGIKLGVAFGVFAAVLLVIIIVILILLVLYLKRKGKQNMESDNY